MILIASGYLLKYTYKHSYGTFLNVFYIGYYMIQLSIACLILLLNKDFCLWNDWHTPLRKAILPFSLAVFVANVGILIGNMLSNRIVHVKYNYSIENQMKMLINRYNVHYISIFFMLVFSFSILTSLNVSYIVAVFALTFSFCPIFVGFMWRMLSKTDKALWVIVLTVNMLFHALQGSRGTAFFPIIFAIVGYIISIKNNKYLLRKRLISFVLIGAISMPVLSFISAFREINGRGLDVSFDTFNQMVSFAQNSSKTIDDDDGINQSLGRMLIHANVSTPLLTPYPVPYRDFECFKDEIVSIFSLSGESGSKQNRFERGEMGYGTGVATKYGYHVNEWTSVEWPIFADGFSRFGYIGLFIYSIIFAFFLSWLEKKSKNIWSSNALLSLIFHLFILYNGVLSYMYSYYAFMKLLVFRLPLVIIIVWIFSLIVRKNIKYENSYYRSKP